MSHDPAVYEWLPTADYIENANVTRLGRSHGIGTLPELRARSVADVGWYWDAVVTDLGIPFRTPYESVIDISAGIERPEWFTGSTINIVDACLTRWQNDVGAGRIAVSHEAEDGTVTNLTYAELAERAAAVAGGLRELGVKRGDTVALFLPMIPEAVVACYAIASLGAIIVPLFSGFAPSAIAARIRDAGAVAVIVADGTVRRHRTVEMKALLDEAVASCPTVERVVVVTNVGGGSAASGTDVAWESLLAATPLTEPVALPATETLLLAYTSGTTGKPKGAVHTHAGFLVKTASEVAYSFDVNADGVFCWITDMGWIMGPLSIFGTHANGATLVLYEGSPDVPDIDRLWSLVQNHRISMLGVSPTLIRTLRASGSTTFRDYDLSSVHVLGSTGEPWDPSAYEWLAVDVFGDRVPIINFSGGTEVGGSFLAPYPVETIRSCSLGGPSLGMDVDVVDANGDSVRGEVGELVCRQPWPAMTRGVWKDDDRYLEAYWTTFPGMWHHGDFALVEDDQWFILGRSDDVMNVAGKRLAPAEVESVLITHPAVVEAAAVGVPDSTKGETVWAFWVPRASSSEDVSEELRALVASELGKPFAPSLVRRVSQLPKTRSQKIMRRAVRAAALGLPQGDLSGAENPDAVNEISRAVGDQKTK
ncbi:AMP-dependent synthetase [Subtercola boreus]|uniref:acetate--CoA ligase n=1 Tax=Subtercola boreus TaxID=120213 RepID=A0A3E0VKT4_9MICO|nr:AMP-binding protein [Subtercola boreus]RFA10496.1 AMP-dependent synthetase [Subtercola boreus]TQL55967.1 acetyl-CoA synthetase [Subtercola boreus]